LVKMKTPLNKFRPQRKRSLEETLVKRRARGEKVKSEERRMDGGGKSCYQRNKNDLFKGKPTWIRIRKMALGRKKSRPVEPSQNQGKITGVEPEPVFHGQAHWGLI